MSAKSKPPGKDWKRVDDLYQYCTTDRQREVLQIIERSKTSDQAAKKAGYVSPRPLFRVLEKLRAKRDADESRPALDFDPIPHADLPAPELFAARKRAFARKDAHEKAIKIQNVRITIPGPIGILHFGDPHVDDDGTDLEQLERHCHLVTETEGLFGANVGDTTNNWIGRLARLYADQATTATQAWTLCEYFLHFCPGLDPSELTASARKALLSNWLYLIGGNHDAWSGAGDPIIWMTRQSGAQYAESQVRLRLKFPGGRECRINARHDFSGYSMWNPAHGAMKAAQKGFHDHILVNGHRHVSGYGIIKSQADGTLSHCIQVASYKVHDRFSKTKGFPDQHISPAVVTIIDPDAKSELEFVTVFHNVERGVDYLRWLRDRAA